MSDFSETELFSAYLDGELTADEQVRVEQILATSPEARQMLEELRAVGGALQSLPQETLDDTLAARVLAAAERRMLSPAEPDTRPSAGRAAAALAPAADDASASQGFPWRELSWRGMLTPRALIWSAIIVVVGVIIHYKSPPQPQHRDVARLDGPAAGASNNDAPQGKSEATEGGRAMSDGSWVSADKPAAARPEMVAPAKKLADANFAGAAKSPEVTDHSLVADSDTGGKSGGGGLKRGLRDGVEAMKQKDAAPAAVPQAAPPIVAASPAMPRGAGTAGLGGEVPNGIVDNGSIVEKMEAAPAPAAPPLQVAKAAGGGNQFGPARNTVLVRLDVSADAARRGLFNELLISNGIAAREFRDGWLSLALRDAKSNDGGLAAEQAAVNVPMSISGGTLSTIDTNGQQQIAPAFSESVQNGASRAAAIAPRKAAPSASAQQAAAAPQSPAAAEPANDVQQDRAATDNRSKRAHATAKGEPTALYFECEASPEQFDSLMKQIGQRGDAFGSPVPAVTGWYGWSAAGEHGLPEKNDKPGERDALGAAQGNAAQYDVAQSNVVKLRDQTKAQEGSATEVQSRLQSAPAVAPPVTATAHVRFVLNVVDRVAVPPALAVPAAAPAPAAKGK